MSEDYEEDYEEEWYDEDDYDHDELYFKSIDSIELYYEVHNELKARKKIGATTFIRIEDIEIFGEAGAYPDDNMTVCETLPFKVDMVGTWCKPGSAVFSNLGLTTMKNLPRCTDQLNISDNNISSLKDVHLYIKKCKSLDVGGNPVVKGGIGILLIEGIKSIMTNDGATWSRFEDAIDIIYEYVHNGKVGKEYILECQEELLAAGLDEYAEL